MEGHGRAAAEDAGAGGKGGTGVMLIANPVGTALAAGGISLGVGVRVS